LWEHIIQLEFNGYIEGVSEYYVKGEYKPSWVIYWQFLKEDLEDLDSLDLNHFPTSKAFDYTEFRNELKRFIRKNELRIMMGKWYLCDID
jgi:hypothetical protein